MIEFFFSGRNLLTRKNRPQSNASQSIFSSLYYLDWDFNGFVDSRVSVNGRQEVEGTDENG